MKTLLIGFLAFSVWSTFTTYVYVCKIKGLCNEPTTSVIVTNNISTNNNPFVDNLQKEPSTDEQAAIPDKQVVYFAFDKFDFNVDKATLKYLNDSKLYLDQNSQAKLNITGFADSVGTQEYNMALGYRRAQSLQQYFERMGVQSTKIIIDSKGENTPADNNATAAGRANNRRTELTINQ